MDVRKEVSQQIDSLNESELHQVARYLTFLRSKSRISQPAGFDEDRLAALYGEFAEEDRQLAEEGLSDYARALAEEDLREA
jgi:hypothetical protein